jgi:hypothetical protein
MVQDMVKSRVVFATSHADDPFTAMEEIGQQLGGERLAGAIVFCPHRADAQRLAWAINMQTEGCG